MDANLGLGRYHCYVGSTVFRRFILFVKEWTLNNSRYNFDTNGRAKDPPWIMLQQATPLGDTMVAAYCFLLCFKPCDCHYEPMSYTLE